MPVAERTTVRSLAVDRHDQVFVGGVGDFGVLRPDTLGFQVYESLRTHVPEAERGFTDVWTIHSTTRGVVFQSPERLFRWDGEQMSSWGTSSRFRTAFGVDGDVYVWEEGVGLRMLGPEAIESIHGGEAFAHRKVDALLPHPRGLLAVVRDEGLVVLQNGREVPLDTDGSAYLRAFRPYTAAELPNPYTSRGGLYAVATFNGGVAVLDEDGQLVRIYREDVGLMPTDLNVGLHLDDQGGLWVARLTGLTRIDLFASLTRFDETTGLEGSVYSVVEHKGIIYTGTSNGLFRLIAGGLGHSEADPSYARFEKVKAAGDAQTYATLSTRQGLLVGTRDGIWALAGSDAYPVSSTESFALLAPHDADGLILFGSKEGVGRLVYRDGRWVESEPIVGINGEIRHLEEDADGRVWASELNGVLARIDGAAEASPSVKIYGPTRGLKVSAGPLVRRGDEVWMAPREGVFSLSESIDGVQLKPVSGLESLAGIYGLYGAGGSNGPLWVNEGGLFYSPNLGGRQGAAPALEFRDAVVTDLLTTEAGVLWIGTSDGLLRYDPRVRELGRSYTASVRMVTDRDRVPLFAGVGAAGAGEALGIPYARGQQIRFEVAATFFDAPGVIEYQYRLDGFDDDWAAWSDERVASYTNLWPGTYTLFVRARDQHGRQSAVTTFAVHIEPPWYLTWWAYGAYAVAGILLMWALTWWRSREHRRKLDMQSARSARFQRLSTRLEKTNARLRQADKLKDDLLANTSHELRTPLTAILGFSEMLLDDVDGENRSLAEGINRGGQRLLTTVNGLLDMFKLQSGTMPVEARDVDAAQSVRNSVALLAPLAASRGTDLRVLPEGLALPATIDPDLLDRIVTNVVSNAIKFTEAGRVLVLVDGDEQSLYLTVQDTGIGIARDDVKRILEPFEQVSTGFQRSHEGTGLGLSIVQRVLTLVGGRIEFDSEVGVGTTVRITVSRDWTSCSHSPDVDLSTGQPALDGIHVLGVGLDEASVRAVRRAVGAQGVVAAAPTLGRALREARTTVFDVILVATSEEGSERRQVRAIRKVPGYMRVPMICVGTAPQEDSSLAEYVDHLSLPLQADRVGASLEAALSRVETLADHALVSGI